MIFEEADELLLRNFLLASIIETIQLIFLKLSDIEIWLLMEQHFLHLSWRIDLNFHASRYLYFQLARTISD